MSQNEKYLETGEEVKATGIKSNYYQTQIDRLSEAEFGLMSNLCCVPLYIIQNITLSVLLNTLVNFTGK